MSTFRVPLLTSVVLVIVLLNIARIEVAATQCYDDGDCRSGYGDKYCCRGKYFYDHGDCEEDCVGHMCRSSQDCATGECCHSDKCSEDCFTGLAGGIIAAIIIGTIILIAIPVAIIVCCCCCGAAAASASSRRPVNRGVILSQPGGMTVVTSQNVQSMQAGSSYPVASYPGAPVYPAPFQNPAPIQNPPLYNPYPQKPGQHLPPQQVQGPPPAYSNQ